MGFGLLFIGCFITYLGAIVPDISMFTYVLGAGVILLSLRTLMFENKLFLSSAICTLLLEIAGIAVLAMDVMSLSVKATAYILFAYIRLALGLILILLLMLAIAKIAKEADDRKIRVKAIINTVFISVGILCTFLYEIVRIDAFRQVMGIVASIIQILYTVFALFIVFTCYMRLCYEDDLKMEKKTSGIPFLDFLNKLLDKAGSKRNKGDKK